LNRSYAHNKLNSALACQLEGTSNGGVLDDVQAGWGSTQRNLNHSLVFRLSVATNEDRRKRFGPTEVSLYVGATGAKLDFCVHATGDLKLGVQVHHTVFFLFRALSQLLHFF